MENAKLETFMSRGTTYVIYRTATTACIMTKAEYMETFG